MSLIALVLILAIVCLAIYAVQSFLPGPPVMKNIICLVLVLIAILYLLGALGVTYGRVHL